MHILDCICAKLFGQREISAVLAGVGFWKIDCDASPSCSSARLELLYHEIDEDTDLRRQVPGLRIDHPDRLRRRCELVQDGNKLAAGDRLVDEKILQLRQAAAGARGVADGDAVAEADIALRVDRSFNAASGEAPCPGLPRLAESERQAIVPGQILDALRPAEFGEIGRRPDDAKLGARKPPGNQAGILQDAEADASVDALVDEIDIAIVEGH